MTLPDRLLLGAAAVGLEEGRRVLHRPLLWRLRGAKPILSVMKAREPIHKLDSRITGAPVIDKAMNEVGKGLGGGGTDIAQASRSTPNSCWTWSSATTFKTGTRA